MMNVRLESRETRDYSAIVRPVACQTSKVDADRRGVRITLSRSGNGSSRGSGSTWKTSGPAPAIRRVASGGRQLRIDPFRET